MSSNQTVIIDTQLLSAFGVGIDVFWEDLLQSQTAITENSRFPTEQFTSSLAALFPDIKFNDKKSAVLQMLEIIKEDKKLIIKNG